MTAARSAPPAIAGDTQPEAELLVERRGDVTRLLSPGVGLFTGARAPGDLLGAGCLAGVLLTLGRAVRLRVPVGLEGRIVALGADGGELSRRPVGWGDVLYEVSATAAEPKGEAAAVAAESRAASGPAGRLLLRSPQSGRFYRRPGPGEEAFVVEGAVVEEGQPIGLIEVMKTFAQVRYTTAGGLPPSARVVALLVEDGAEVAAGEALLELSPVGA